LNVLQLINVRWYNACAYYAVTLSCALSRRGHKVIVAGDPHSPPMVRAEKLGLATRQDLHLSRTNPWMVAYNVKRIMDLVRAERIDIIDAHRGESHVAAALAGRLLKGGVGIVRTRGDARPPRRSALSRWLNGELTDKIITTCELLRGSYINNLQMNLEKVVSVPVGIDHEFFSPREVDLSLKAQLQIPLESPVVGMVGRLSPVKGHRYFMESAQLVLKSFPRTVFVICGEDAQISSTQLKKHARDMAIHDNFRFLGRVRDIREIISLFHVAVVSSTGSETICRVALEYMSMGKPVVGTKINAIPEVVLHGVNGLVVEPKKPGQMAASLIDLLQDEPKRLRFGQKSRDLVLERFTLDQFARKTEEVYKSLLDRL
jgi:glycosyltransferase involved in cell wall biosynthesis